MAKPQGLFQRGGVGPYYLRVVVPDELRAHYGKSGRIIRSLFTRDRREAHLKAAAAMADALEGFAAKRRELNPSGLDAITPELAALLAQRLYAGLMALDDTARGNPEAAQMLIALDRGIRQRAIDRLTIGTPDAVPLPLPAMGSQWDGLSQEQAGEWSRINGDMDAFTADLLTRQAIGAALPMLRAEAGRLGFTFTDSAPGIKEALRLSLSAYRKAMQDRSARDRGDIIATPEAETIKSLPPKAYTLRDIYDRWKDKKTRTADTIKACGRALALFEERLSNTPLVNISRSQGDEFAGWLQTLGTTSKTAKDRFTWIKSLLKYAYKTLELIPRHPWDGLDIESRVTSRRYSWTEEQLNILFGQPLFTEYRLPTLSKAGADAAYWLPVLAIYTGARLSELCQLRVADVSIGGAIPAVSITDDAEHGQQTKNEGSVRDVPIHSELIRLGFLEYVKNTGSAGHDRLFPALPLRTNKSGGYFSAWFGEYKPDEMPTFHEFRHTARTAMSESGIGLTAQDMDCITGHVVRGSSGSRHYTHPTQQSRKRTVEAITYPSLKLNRVYPG